MIITRMLNRIQIFLSLEKKKHKKNNLNAQVVLEIFVVTLAQQLQKAEEIANKRNLYMHLLHRRLGGKNKIKIENVNF